MGKKKNELMETEKNKKVGNYVLVFQTCQTTGSQCTHNIYLGLYFQDDGIVSFKPSTFFTQFTENIASKFSEKSMKPVKCIRIIFQH